MKARPEEADMYVSLCCDVEDIFAPPEKGLDDVIKWMADILADEGLRGTFLIVGQKIRQLEERERRDVISALARHDVGSHTDSTLHPFPWEYLEDKDWEDGLREAIRREEPAVRDIEAITGRRPSCLSRHGGDFAAQLVGAAGKMDLAYLYFPTVLPPGRTAAWYVGVLNLEMLWGFGGFDSVYSDDRAFQRRLRELDARIAEEVRKGTEFAVIFLGHPCVVKAKDFPGIIAIANGRNMPRERWGEFLPEFRTEEEMRRAKENYRKLVRYIREHSDLEVKTVAEVRELYVQKSHIDREELLEVARRAVSEGEVLPGGYFSAGEVLLAWAESVRSFASEGELPESLGRRDVLGPVSDPLRTPELPLTRYGLGWGEVVYVAEAILEHVRSTGHLPAWVVLGEGRRIGLGSAYEAMAKVYLQLDEGRSPDWIPLEKFAPKYPTVAERMDGEVRASLYGGVRYIKPDINLDKISRHIRLQCWTLKPALLRTEGGKP